MTRFSFSDMTRLLRSGPAITRSMASSSSVHRDATRRSARGEERRLVDGVGEIGAGEPRGAAGEHVEVDVVGERLALRVHVEDGLAADEVGAIDDDLAIEPAGPQQRRVEDVGTVGGGDQDDAGGDVEAVHLDEQLVEGLLALVVTAARGRRRDGGRRRRSRRRR